jgi:hypothetical protein
MLLLALPGLAFLDIAYHEFNTEACDAKIDVSPSVTPRKQKTPYPITAGP